MRINQNLRRMPESEQRLLDNRESGYMAQPPTVDGIDKNSHCQPHNRTGPSFSRLALLVVGSFKPALTHAKTLSQIQQNGHGKGNRTKGNKTP
jgi:hypothetical protein